MSKINIGTKIKDLRMAKGMTQDELANKVQVSQAFIAQVERGTKTVSLPIGFAIAAALGVSINEFK